MSDNMGNSVFFAYIIDYCVQKLNGMTIIFSYDIVFYSNAYHEYFQCNTTISY